MRINQIINKKFFLKKQFLINKKKFYNAKPFPHIVFDNFFKKNFLEKILNDFPDLQQKKNSIKYNVQNEKKFALNQFKLFPVSIKVLFNFLNSNFFLNFLQNISSIDEKLIADKNLHGGGLHQIKSGGFLKIHSDFNRHPVKNLDRRLNVLIYLNKNWKKKYGGELEFWDKHMRNCKKKILPTFNKMVIFSTTDFSNHGHPDPLKCPNNLSRKSIAIYYYSKGRPPSEIDKMYLKNRTYFKDRKNKKSETFQSETKIKRVVRSLQFYQFLKKVEKNYFRKFLKKINT